jgi:hypothetical protein
MQEIKHVSFCQIPTTYVIRDRRFEYHLNQVLSLRDSYTWLEASNGDAMESAR